MLKWLLYLFSYLFLISEKKKEQRYYTKVFWIMLSTNKMCWYTTFVPFMNNNTKWNKEKNVPLRYDNRSFSELWAKVSIGNIFHKKTMIYWPKSLLQCYHFLQTNNWTMRSKHPVSLSFPRSALISGLLPVFIFYLMKQYSCFSSCNYIL